MKYIDANVRKRGIKGIFPQMKENKLDGKDGITASSFISKVYCSLLLLLLLLFLLLLLLLVVVIVGGGYYFRL